ncbi:hypothetical protein RHP47_08710 [Thermosynechococcus sp. QKsg1]|nr:hypothetical protein MZ909_08730 [Thermosynechococcus sp. B0]WJI25822.1 hypothetical protein M0644_08800 [Thermosynechococcus sp. B1]WJI28350.1 hypothetical protein M0646_08795 [Thermosynechococcus sp. B3]WKT82911.1 hypothetical protein QYC28_08745 [Thermosynechococcus sp. HY596]WNC62038.1 hypothetical protein RHK13_08740 [Thermosynechococcus sp. HY591]WNC64591.1 hypothetical protein RHK28_08770 [Thermosynechococcus sp. HY593]WNC85924.1 hypothetical protein RHP47_08710 [Thermosynechococcus
MPQGQILSLAEGEGRNAVYLAQERGVSITTYHCDLRDVDLGENAWDGIIVIFCHLPPERNGKIKVTLSYCYAAATHP